MTENSLLQHTARVTFELSNRCPYAVFHNLCPLHKAGAPVTLPAEIVASVLSFMAAEGFDREVAYHNYSEPLIDPRLFMFLHSCRDLNAAKSQYVLTNGWALDQQMLDELVLAGATRVWCSAYGHPELNRLEELRAPTIDYRVKHWGRLDNRIEQYDREPVDLAMQCCEPLENLVIRATGDVALCCMDWKGTVTFGNLKETSLADVLKQPEITAIWKRNMAGDRKHHPVCRRCKAKRISKLCPPQG